MDHGLRWGTRWTGLGCSGAAGAAGAAAVALGIAVFAGGCVTTTPDASFNSGGGGVYGSGSGSSGGTPTQPMLVVVDTDRTLGEEGGQGVGVFTEYKKGGHWTIRWACDTGITKLACQFLIHVTLASDASDVETDGGGAGEGEAASAITNLVNAEQSSNASLSQLSATTLTASSTTYAALDAMSFDTPEGATITLEANVNGTDDGKFLFFVQDGTVNGGYQGVLSDPIQYVPSSP